MIMGNRIIFLDGQFVTLKPQEFVSLAPGKVKEQGVFETMRAYEGKIFTLKEHLERMRRGLRILKIKTPINAKNVEENLNALLSKKRLKNTRMRVTVWQEKGDVRTAMTAEAIKLIPELKYKEGFRVTISSKIHPSGNPYLKAVLYQPFYEASLEAERNGFDEAILLNKRRELVEGTRTNIFFIKNKILYTPAIRLGCLSGVTRLIVMKLAGRLKIPCRETAAFREDLLNADEAFLTNSLIEVMAIKSLGQRMIGLGKEGPLTRQVREAYRLFVKYTLSI